MLYDLESAEFNPTTDTYVDVNNSRYLLRESYRNAVLYKGEHNYYDDSDFYAIVWNGSKLEEIEYSSTRSWSYYNTAHVDATEDILLAAEAWLVPIYVERLKSQFDKIVNDPTSLGATVKSTTTRGKNKDVIGKVMWKGKNSIGMPIVGLKVTGREKLSYLGVDKVEVCNVELPDPEAILRRAQEKAAERLWYKAFTKGV